MATPSIAWRPSSIAAASSKRPSSDDITKPKGGKKPKGPDDKGNPIGVDANRIVTTATAMLPSHPDLHRVFEASTADKLPDRSPLR